MIRQAGAELRLPEELKRFPQWAVAGANKAPLTVGSSGSLVNTSVVRPSEWMSFERAFDFVSRSDGRLHLGFILNEYDPFTCIDFDIKDAETHPNEPDKWTKPEQWNLHWKIVQSLNSYTEYSRSGKGLHVWVKGSIGRGFRRDGVEVYSQERFIICTGDILFNKTIEDRQLVLSNMVSQMRPMPKQFVLEELPPEDDDWYIFERAENASNGEKFLKLWRGEWDDMGFPSQSEADLALMSMLAFYSESNMQCRRMFRDSALGQRPKARKNDKYLDYTLTTIRQRQAREESADVSALFEKKNEIASVVQEMQGGVPATLPTITTPFGKLENRVVSSLHVPGQGEPTQAAQPPEVRVVHLAPVDPQALADTRGLPWPPGIAGKIAQYIYKTANRPVKEIAIVSALGLLAGICGKAWHIPQSGLNLYIILVARSAIGKETMSYGISSIINACAKENPSFHKFVDFTEYVSGPALIKACVANPCFVNVSGEWGRRLKRLAQENQDGALQTLRTQMTNLYQKSGPQAIVGGIGYSSTDNNIASVAGVSYSMIGETTPSTFFQSLTESMMEDGFLSRFIIVEYDGNRVASNPEVAIAPDDTLKTAINNMAMQADLMMAKNHSHAVLRTEECSAMMAAFEKECDDAINGTEDEARRQMWNRAALKSYRIAALLAVADNFITPCMTAEHMNWALEVVRRDIQMMRKHLEGGDVGSSDDSRERKMVSILKEYISEPPGSGYKIPKEMHELRIVPRSYMQQRSGRTASFYQHRLGRAKAVDDVIQSMVQNGYLLEMPRSKIVELFGAHGRCYKIVKLPNYEEM